MDVSGFPENLRKWESSNVIQLTGLVEVTLRFFDLAMSFYQWFDSRGNKNTVCKVGKNQSRKIYKATSITSLDLNEIKTLKIKIIKSDKIIEQDNQYAQLDLFFKSSSDKL